MNTIKSIRERFGVTQAALAQGMGCTQANVSFYENGQTVPPEAANRLIAYALALGYEITFNDIYSVGITESAAPLVVVAPGYAGPERRDPNHRPVTHPTVERRLVNEEV